MQTSCAVLVALGLMLAACGAAPPANTPAQIIFLRHGEKPETGPELSERGMARAKALVPLFTQDSRMLEHGPAVAIFVMKPSKSGGSVRALETMAPTAQALKLKLDRHFTRDETAPLMHAILSTRAYAGKTVIVCWEHEVLPDMLKASGWTGGPTHWSDKTFDRLWVLDFENGKPVRLRDLPQKILPGDSPQ